MFAAATIAGRNKSGSYVVRIFERVLASNEAEMVRRRRDSNPRNLAVHRFLRPFQSTALARPRYSTNAPFSNHVQLKRDEKVERQSPATYEVANDSCRKPNRRFFP